MINKIELPIQVSSIITIYKHNVLYKFQVVTKTTSSYLFDINNYGNLVKDMNAIACHQ